MSDVGRDSGQDLVTSGRGTFTLACQVWNHRFSGKIPESPALSAVSRRPQILVEADVN